jgi:hypothetical protein
MNRHQRRAERARARKQGTGYMGRIASAPWSHPPGVHHVTVAHDGWCGIFKGKDCTCTPDIYRRADGSDVIETVAADGSITKARAS